MFTAEIKSDGGNLTLNALKWI